MAIKPELKGKKHPPFEYEVGREKIREYAWAVGESNSVHLEPDAARASQAALRSIRVLLRMCFSTSKASNATSQLS